MVMKKTINIENVKDILESIINKKINREQASEWAYELREAADKNLVEFIPTIQQPLLWESILFIEGIDLQDLPGSYLHNEDDIINFLGKVLMC